MTAADRLECFGQRTSHRDSAGGTPADGQVPGGGIFPGDEFLADRDEVPPSIGFVDQLTGLVPLTAILAAAANVRVPDDCALIDERKIAPRKGWCVGRETVRTVG